MGHQATSDIISQLSRTLGFRQQQKLQQKANEPIRQSPIRQDISFTKHGERGDKISQQKLQQKANEPIRQSPIRQDISFTKRGERGDKISQQKLQQKANKPMRQSPIRQDISFTKRGERGDKIPQQEFQQENEQPRPWTTSDIISQMSKTLGLQQKTEVQRRSKKRNETETRRA